LGGYLPCLLSDFKVVVFPLCSFLIYFVSSYVCSLKYLFKVIDLLFYLTDNNVLCSRSIEPVAKFIMSVR